MKTGVMTIFKRALNKRDRTSLGVTNATRSDGTNYLNSSILYYNEFGRFEEPVIRAAIVRDVKKSFSNAGYDSSNIEVVSVKLASDQVYNTGFDIRGEQCGFVSINVRR